MDQTTTARINLNGVLRTLELLPDLDPQAAALAQGASQTIQFTAPSVDTIRLVIGDGRIGHFAGAGPSRIRLFFPRPAMVNKMFSGTGKPIPIKGFSQIGYLTGPFTKLTERLSYFLRATPELLADPEYRHINAILTMHLAIYATAEIGNSDDAGRSIASRMPDGELLIAVKQGPQVTLAVRGNRLRVHTDSNRHWRAKMVFADLEIAGQVLRGELAPYTAIGRGQIDLGGYVPLLDNTNKLLGLVPRYLG